MDSLKEYSLSVQAYKHGSVELATFRCENDSQASLIANRIIDDWEDATGDNTYRWYLHPIGEPEKYLSV